MKYVDRLKEKENKQNQAEYEKLMREQNFKNSMLRRLNEIRYEHYKKTAIGKKVTG